MSHTRTWLQKTNDRLKVLWNGKIRMLSYKAATVKSSVQCDIHGKLPIKYRPRDLCARKFSPCRHCQPELRHTAAKARWAKSKERVLKNNLSTFKVQVVEKFKARVVIKSSYMGHNKPIEVLCNICHHEWTTTPTNLLTSVVGCPPCGRKKANLATAKSHSQYVKECAIATSNAVKPLQKYSGDSTALKHKCICGHIYMRRPNTILQYPRPGCRSCQPKGNFSRACIEWLGFTEKVRGISIKHVLQGGEFKIKHKGKTYSVDGYDPTSNTIFEYLGSDWHGGPLKYKSSESQCHPHSSKTAGELLFSTMKRLHKIASLGYTVVYVWDIDFNKDILVSGIVPAHQ